jgi:predicted PurR-regulated permease PerM
MKASGKLFNLWFAVAVIGLFVFACFYIRKVAVDLFLPIVLAGFLGFLPTPISRCLKKIGLPTSGRHLSEPLDQLNRRLG